MNRSISRNTSYLLPVLALIWTSAHAADLSVPNTFSAGTPAVAAQVNANFSAVETAVDDNNSRIAALESQVSSLLNQISDLQDTIADLQAGSQFVTDLDAVVNVDTVNDRVVFSGVNVQIDNGMAATATVNGLGNLIVGYDEAGTSSDKTGSHNVVIGAEHNYSSHSGLVAGYQNAISGIGASVSSGMNNEASGDYSSVSGGQANDAGGAYSSISGGLGNEASGQWSSVSGGGNNTAEGDSSVVSGGNSNVASSPDSTVSGGEELTTTTNAEHLP